jgi:hypothetical protein
MFVDFLLLLIAILSVMLLGAYAIWEARDAEYYRQEVYRLRRELVHERMRR